MEFTQPTAQTSELSKKVSLSFLRMTAPPTVVHRSQLKARPSLASFDQGAIDLLPEVSPSTSTETSGNSGKSSLPENHKHSTGKTSQDSKFSGLPKNVSGQSQHSSENKKMPFKQLAAEGSVESQLTPIQEIEAVEVAPAPVPSKFLPQHVCFALESELLTENAAVITVEKAAAAKIFFECHYNELLSNTVSPRSLRRRELEGVLYEDDALSPYEKDHKRRSWARRESEHLRGIRIMKSRARMPKRADQMASMYEVVKVLGKGSFGVVRLVREKSPDE